MTTLIRPIEHIKSDQQFHVSVSRSWDGYHLGCQLSPEQYAALDGRKFDTEFGKISFRRWTKVVQDGDFDVEIDRMYVSIGRVIRGYGWANDKLGFLEVCETSVMTADESGNRGDIVAKFDGLEEGLCKKLAEILEVAQ